jgi:hypothetical protein
MFVSTAMDARFDACSCFGHGVPYSLMTFSKNAGA